MPGPTVMAGASPVVLYDGRRRSGVDQEVDVTVEESKVVVMAWGGG